MEYRLLLSLLAVTEVVYSPRADSVLMVTLDCAARLIICDSAAETSGARKSKPGEIRINVRCPGRAAILRTTSSIAEKDST